MMTSISTSENIIFNTRYDSWLFNKDAEYHEQEIASDRKFALKSIRLVPIDKKSYSNF